MNMLDEVNDGVTEILILDYNRKNQLFDLLTSIKEKALFEKRVVVLNNGGEKYADEFLKLGLCDVVINNEINIGCGAGTVQLFSQCNTEYALYVQVDHVLDINLNEIEINLCKQKINDGWFYIDFAGDQGRGVFSERAFFINRVAYLGIPKGFGGPGPLDNLYWSEESIQDYMKMRGLQFLSFYGGSKEIPFRDCGHNSVRINPDGSKWEHKPDTKVLKCLLAPTTRFTFPPLTVDEWEIALGGRWPEEGKIPDAWKNASFEVWNKLP